MGCVSVVVPALNEADRIEAAVRSVGPCADGQTEVIVADGGSTDATVAIARGLAAVVTGARGRGAQMNLGARRATGDVLLFLHADSVLPAGGLDAVRHVLRDPGVVGGTFTLQFDCEHPLLRLYAYCTQYRWRYFHYGDQGVFVRRAIFERIGGFRELPLMEDIDLLRRLRRVGRVALIPLPVTTSARRFHGRGLFRQQALNVALVTLYILGAEPARLARWYR